MKRFTLCTLVLTVMVLASVVWAGEDKPEPQIRLEIDLVDGSHIIGVPSIESVPVQTSYARMDVPLREIRTIKIDADHETASLDLQNGDKIKGVLTLAPVKLEAVFGKVSIGIEHIKDLRVMIGGGTLPAGEGTMAFGGVNWTPWRTLFEIQKDKLVSLPKARPGFNYGHGGNGRGPGSCPTSAAPHGRTTAWKSSTACAA